MDTQQDYIIKNLTPLIALLSQTSVGDFSHDLSIPETDNEFTQVYVGVQVLLEVVREKIAELQTIDKAKTEFVSLASHQLRTPTTTIKWYTELLLQEHIESLNDKQKKYISEIHLASQRMIKLTNALLDISRLELDTIVLIPEQLMLPTVIDNIFKDNLPKIQEKQLHVIKHFSEHLPVITMDKKLLLILLENLIANAIKYTPNDGTITLSLMEKDNNMLITIADTGYGIPKNQRERIFTKFFRADNIKAFDQTGTGLGLYLVKTVVDKVGGKVKFESHTKEETDTPGTTFYVTIPIK